MEIFYCGASEMVQKSIDLQQMVLQSHDVHVNILMIHFVNSLGEISSPIQFEISDGFESV